MVIHLFVEGSVKGLGRNLSSTFLLFKTDRLKGQVLTGPSYTHICSFSVAHLIDNLHTKIKPFGCKCTSKTS